MHGKLLIINSYHPNARYVPMGAFGICDYLVSRGHQARIFNSALYPPQELSQRLEAEVLQFEPTVFGLIMQWKEYTESALRLARDLKQRFPEIPIIAGGMTAGYFTESLTRRHRSIDGVIRGDAEEPLHLLLSGTPWSKVPNLVHRDDDGDIAENHLNWQTDSAILNQTSFTGLDRMTDHQKYLQAIEPVLGFPIFIGRGCLHRCQYCGGSSKAFAEHSGRERPVYRSTAAVIRDLRQLIQWTTRIYIGFENSTPYLKKLFRLVAEDPDLCGALYLNYGAWGLPDRELLELYGRAFRVDGRHKPILEISPETAIDDDRRQVRDPALFFSNRQLLDTLEVTQELFGSDLRVELYYSRYHHTHDSPEKLVEELDGIHTLYEYLERRGYDNVVVTNYHLATDVGSDNWDRLMAETGGDGLDTLLRGLRRMRSPGPGHPPMDNLCLYAPPSLARGTVEAHDQLVSWLELLSKQRRECYFTAARVLGYGCLVHCLQSVIEKRRRTGWGEEVTFVGLIHLLRALAREVEDVRYGVSPERQELVHDLIRLHAGHLATLTVPVETEEGGMIHRPVLEEEKLCLTGWDLFGDTFHRRLKTSNDLPPREHTINVFCGHRIFNFPGRLEPWFRLFDGSRTAEEVLQEIVADDSLNNQEIRDLVVFFTRHHPWFTC